MWSQGVIPNVANEAILYAKKIVGMEVKNTNVREDNLMHIRLHGVLGEQPLSRPSHPPTRHKMSENLVTLGRSLALTWCPKWETLLVIQTTMLGIDSWGRPIKGLSLIFQMLPLFKLAYQNVAGLGHAHFGLNGLGLRIEGIGPSVFIIPICKVAQIK